MVCVRYTDLQNLQLIFQKSYWIRCIWVLGYNLNKDEKVTSFGQFFKHLHISFPLRILFLRLKIHPNNQAQRHTDSSFCGSFRKLQSSWKHTGYVVKQTQAVWEMKQPLPLLFWHHHCFEKKIFSFFYLYTYRCSKQFN